MVLSWWSSSTMRMVGDVFMIVMTCVCLSLADWDGDVFGTAATVNLTLRLFSQVVEAAVGADNGLMIGELRVFFGDFIKGIHKDDNSKLNGGEANNEFPAWQVEGKHEYAAD